MKYQSLKLIDEDLLNTSRRSNKTISLDIKKCKEEIRLRKDEIATALKKIYALKTDNFSEWFGEEIIKILLIPDLVKLEKTLSRIQCLKHQLKPSSKANRDSFEEKIVITKQHPIEELARSKLGF